MKMEVLHITELPSYLEGKPNINKEENLQQNQSPFFLSGTETIHKPPGISQVSSRNSHSSEKLSGNTIWGELGTMSQMRERESCLCN